MSNDHLSVDKTLIEVWAGLQVFGPRDKIGWEITFKAMPTTDGANVHI
jgi:hypothetical protein